MKVLIYLEEDRLAPVGGPLGVGFHIQREVTDRNLDSIFFLPGDATKKELESKQKKWLYKHKWLTKIVRSYRHICEYQSMFNNLPDTSDYLNQFDVVHFHRTSDMYKQRNSLKKFKVKVLITSHSPVPLAQELMDASATSVETAYFKRNWSKFREMDAWAFQNADYILFPCKEA